MLRLITELESRHLVVTDVPSDLENVVISQHTGEALLQPPAAEDHISDQSEEMQSSDSSGETFQQ